MSGIDDYFSRRTKSKFQTKINKIIRDAKQFNEKIDAFIKKTEYEQSLPPIRLNQGIIRKMVEHDKKIRNERIRRENQKRYELAKRQYETDLHNIMEKLIQIKEK